MTSIICRFSTLLKLGLHPLVIMVQNLHLEQLNAESVANVQVSLHLRTMGEIAGIKALGLPIVFLADQYSVGVRLRSLLPAIMLAQSAQIIDHFQKVGIDDIGFLGGLETSRSGREQFQDVRPRHLTCD